MCHKKTAFCTYKHCKNFKCSFNHLCPTHNVNRCHVKCTELSGILHITTKISRAQKRLNELMRTMATQSLANAPDHGHQVLEIVQALQKLQVNHVDFCVANQILLKTSRKHQHLKWTIVFVQMSHLLVTLQACLSMVAMETKYHTVLGRISQENKER